LWFGIGGAYVAGGEASEGCEGLGGWHGFVFGWRATGLQDGFFDSSEDDWLNFVKMEDKVVACWSDVSVKFRGRQLASLPPTSAFALPTKTITNIFNQQNSIHRLACPVLW
jgi:hypothetical protein